MAVKPTTIQIVTYQRRMPVTTAMVLRQRIFGQYEEVTLKHYEAKLKEILEKFQALPDRNKLFKFKFKLSYQIESIGETVRRTIAWLRVNGVCKYES